MKRQDSGFYAAWIAAMTGLAITSTSGLVLAAQGNHRGSAHATTSSARTVAQAGVGSPGGGASPAASTSGAPAMTTSPAASSGGLSDPGAAAAPAGSASSAAPAMPAAPAAPESAAPAAPAAAPNASTTTGTTPSAPPADFGSPPSGEVPILFNDHHVYAKPDRLKHGRVLGAIVRGGTVLVPLRSMFEQMGASVSYDPATKMVDVTKPGADVKVQVGKPEVLVNGESRPLDVAPEIYRGAVVVPIRVLSEGMGAYVQWLPEQRTVVVRYLSAQVPTVPTSEPAPASPAPVPASSAAAPAALQTLPPVKTRSPYEHYIVGDYVFSPKVYNELSPGNVGRDSFRVNGAVEFKLFNLPWMLEGDYRHFRYPHNQTNPTAVVAANGGCPQQGEQGCVQQIGPSGSAQTFVPYFSARDSDFEGRFGLKIADPRIYVGVGFVFRGNNYQYPIQRGLGFGAEKLPDLDARFSVYGSAFFFPQISGDFIDPGSGAAFKLQYRLLKYDIGVTFKLFGPLFVDAGFYGDKLFNKQNAPSDITEGGAAYAGLGLEF